MRMEGTARGVVVRWWAVGLRGLAAIALGIVAFGWPAGTFEVLVFLFGALLLLNGALTLAAVLQRPTERGPVRFYLSLVEGLLGVAAGVAVLVLPELSRIVLLYVVAGWAIITGILELVAGIRLRSVLHGEWLLAASGLVSLAFGLLLAFQPGLGITALMWMLGGYALLLGIILTALAHRLRTWDPDAVAESMVSGPETQQVDSVESAAGRRADADPASGPELEDPDPTSETTRQSRPEE